MRSACWRRAARFVGMTAFDAAGRPGADRAERITVINAVPTMFLRLLAEPGVREGRYRAFVAADRVRRRHRDPAESCCRTMTRRVRRRPDGDHGDDGGEPADHADPSVGRVRAAAAPRRASRCRSRRSRSSTPMTARRCRSGQAGELCIRGFGVTPGYFDMAGAHRRGDRRRGLAAQRRPGDAGRGRLRCASSAAPRTW